MINTWRSLLATFVDTSALFALLDREDFNHTRAAQIWEHLVLAGEDLITHSYILVEAAALVQRRLGVGAVRSLEDLRGVLRVIWVDEDLHKTATIALLASGRREVSLVDWMSFVLMNQQAIRRALAFDAHFSEQGFLLWQSDRL